GQLQDELLYGTDRVYRTRTNSSRWQDLVKRPISDAGGLITAMAFAPYANPSGGAFYVGTHIGEVFVDLNGGLDNWPLRNTGLPRARVTALGTDPFDNRIAFAGMGGTGGKISHLFQTQNAGVEWINISGGQTQPPNKRLPDAAINSVIYDRRL